MALFLARRGGSRGREGGTLLELVDVVREWLYSVGSLSLLQAGLLQDKAQSVVTRWPNHATKSPGPRMPSVCTFSLPSSMLYGFGHSTPAATE